MVNYNEIVDLINIWENLRQYNLNDYIINDLKDNIEEIIEKSNLKEETKEYLLKDITIL